MWCAFPERENPARPGPLHIAYVLAVSGATTSGARTAFTALSAYTTSQRWRDGAVPFGVVIFDRQTATGLGQSRSFVMDLRRLAAVPVTPMWFPRLNQADRGVQGHMPKDQQRRYLDVAEALLTRRPELVERLGPLWPGQSKR